MKLKIPKILKISAFYLYKQKSFVPNAIFCASLWPMTVVASRSSSSTVDFYDVIRRDLHDLSVLPTVWCISPKEKEQGAARIVVD